MNRLRTFQHAVRPAIPGATVTVVIPCHNYARYLRSAADSVLTQTDVQVRVVIVDDASTDDSAATARAIAQEDARVVVLENETNRGAVETFNRGLAVADGEYLVRLDADDLLTPGSLGRAVAVMQSFPEVGLVYGHPLHFHGDEDLPTARLRPTDWFTWSGPEWLAARATAGNNVITSPEVLMRRAVVDAVGGQKALAHTHDMEMWLRIAAHADIGYVRGADQAWHREHPLSLSTKADDPEVILAEVRAAFEVLFDGDVPADVPVATLRAAARRAVARAATAYAQRSLDRGFVSDQARRLRRLAVETDPFIASTPAWRRQERHVRRSVITASVGRVPGFVSRACRRVATRAAYRRWARNGVYEWITIDSPRSWKRP